MSDDDAAQTEQSKSSESEQTQQRLRKKTSGDQSTQKRSTASSAKSSTGARRSRATTDSSTSSSASDSKSSSRPSSEKSGSEASGADRAGKSSLTAVSASRKAIEQFGTLTGRAPESVVGVRKNDDGWNVKLEVVEARRVPDTADLLAEYDIDLDAAGELLSYDRTTRYVRGRPTA